MLDLDAALPNENWNLDKLTASINGFLAENKLKMRDVGPLLRAALTGMKQSPSIVHIMLFLGDQKQANGSGLLANNSDLC